MYLPVPVYGIVCYYVLWCGGLPLIEHMYTCVYMYLSNLLRPEHMGHAFSKGGVCDTYENSGNSGVISGISVMSRN